MGQLRLALRTFRRADASLPEAHGRQTLPVCGLLQGLFPIRPPGPAHEETPKLAATYTHTHTHAYTHTHRHHTSATLTFTLSSLSPSPTLGAARFQQLSHRRNSSPWCSYRVQKKRYGSLEKSCPSIPGASEGRFSNLEGILVVQPPG